MRLGDDVLIFIKNTPRTYAWGSRDALPDMLGIDPTGEPQAELWLGSHPGHPATVAKGSAVKRTLIDLIESDPEAYGVDGGQLPFLLKVLAIGAPLSLQVHPDPEQAAAGYAAEEAAGVPRDAPERNYGDPSHKPELLVALSEITALSGFRPLAAVRRDLRLLAGTAPAGPAREALLGAAERLAEGDPEAVRRDFLSWAFSGDPEVRAAIRAVSAVVRIEEPAADPAADPEDRGQRIGRDRRAALRSLAAAHPEDPGIIVSLLLHLVHLQPGESIYLGARQLHAYLSGIGVEVMAASDNVLRAGLTRKHIDIGELCRVVDTGELEDPLFPPVRPQRGVAVWQPDVPDFQLLRARLHRDAGEASGLPDSAEQVAFEARYPVVLIVTEGRVRVERQGSARSELSEVASVRRGQSLYVSAGAPVRLTGEGEVFLATVGTAWDHGCDPLLLTTPIGVRAPAQVTE